MIVMWNKFLWDDYKGIPRETITSMVVEGSFFLPFVTCFAHP